VEHEATTSKISEDQLFYCRQRGLSEEDAVNMIVNGFCREVFKEVPMEFAVEAQNLLNVSREVAVGGRTTWTTREPLHDSREPRAANLASGIEHRESRIARNERDKDEEASPLNTPLLTIRNLHASVEDRAILKGLDLTVNPGEVLAIMGPNGSGKSTLAQVL